MKMHTCLYLFGTIVLEITCWLATYSGALHIHCPPKKEEEKVVGHSAQWIQPLWPLSVQLFHSLEGVWQASKLSPAAFLLGLHSQLIACINLAYSFPWCLCKYLIKFVVLWSFQSCCHPSEHSHGINCNGPFCCFLYWALRELKNTDSTDTYPDQPSSWGHAAQGLGWKVLA